MDHPDLIPAAATRSAAPAQGVEVELIAVIVATRGDAPSVLTIRDATLLPSGPLETAHRSLQAGLRGWVERQTGQSLGYVEQLYTFADPVRSAEQAARRIISISYLALTRQGGEEKKAGEEGAGEAARWESWYRFFPWEDWRDGPPAIIAKGIAPRLRAWAAAAGDAATRQQRLWRARIDFGLSGLPWNEELALQRYEILYEAGLVPEAAADAPVPGAAMLHDHRRILATAIARLRAKIKYRPVVFELMPPSFTLLELQRGVEALAGQALHKQNFRRLLDSQALVEETGKLSTGTGGRPARLFRFRPQVLRERAAAGTKLPLARGG